MGKGCTDYLVPAVPAVRGAQRRFAPARFGRFKLEEAAGDFDSLLVGLQKGLAIGTLLEVTFERRELCGTEIRGEIVGDQSGFPLAGQTPNSAFGGLAPIRRAARFFARRGAMALHRLIYVDGGSNLQILPNR
jgi:hypothetical protein